MNGEVALGGGGIVADLAAVGFVAACVGLPTGQAGMLLPGDAVDAGGLILRVLLLHVDLQSLLILVMPVALGTLQRLAGIVGSVPASSGAANPWPTTQPTGGSSRTKYEIALGTFNTCGPASLQVLWAGANSGPLSKGATGHLVERTGGGR